MTQSETAPIKTRTYVICSNPRSGSTYLVLLLASTGKLGNPWEWLRGDGGKAHIDFETYTGDPEEQLACILTEGRTPNGVCALKMFPEHFDKHDTTRWIGRLPNIHFVYLQRGDLLGQAISLSIARQTDAYASWAERKREAVYDAQHIRRCLDFVAEGEARWRLFFALNGITPLRLTYEEIVAHPQKAVDQVAKLMRVKDAVIDQTVRLTQPQADALNGDWRKRFIAEQGHTLALPQLARTAVAQTRWPLEPPPQLPDSASPARVARDPLIGSQFDGDWAPWRRFQYLAELSTFAMKVGPQGWWIELRELIGSAAYLGLASQWFAVETGDSFEVSAKLALRGARSGQLACDLEWAGDEGEAAIPHYSEQLSAGSALFQRKTMTVRAPEHAKWVRMRLFASALSFSDRQGWAAIAEPSLARVRAANRKAA